MAGLVTPSSMLNARGMSPVVTRWPLSSTTADPVSGWTGDWQDNSSASSNTTNDTVNPFGGAGYPSEYTWLHIILSSVAVTVIILMIVVGNFLVIWAIITDRYLKATQNLFIASLALADFLLGLVVIPFSLATELMGYWAFGTVWCELWKAIDVLLCTASISSLCLISLDRYWSITRAVHYTTQRTPRRAAIMITVVWVVSAAICIPPLIGWKQPQDRRPDWPQCQLSEDIGYVMYSSMGSFYIPAFIMVFVYYKIYQAAKKRARKNVSKAPKAHASEKCEKKTSNDSSTEQANASRSGYGDPSKAPPPAPSDEEEGGGTGSADTDAAPQIELQRLGRPGDEMTKLLSTDSDSCDVTARAALLMDQRLNNVLILSSDTESSSEQARALLAPSKGGGGSKLRAGNGQVIRNALHESRANGSTSTGDESPATPRRRTFLNNFTRHMFRANRSKKESKEAESSPKPADFLSTEKHKRKIAKARERRATVVLGLVMAAFILCWLPFFILYVTSAFCSSCIPPMVFTVFFWIGYCNSALNPVIYTVFNRDFRRAFHRIICGGDSRRRGR